MKLHLDTDFGGDPDDACALAMLLGWASVHLVGVTTCADAEGYRAAFVRHALALANRGDVPVASGAGRSLTTWEIAHPVLDDERHWPGFVEPTPSRPGAALDLLAASIDAGATIVAIGPYTNLALLETLRPGTLGRASVVAMGGWTVPPAPGLPAWGPEMDFNVQWDTRAATILAEAAGDLTLVTLPATLSAHLRAADLPRLRASGPLGRLLAAQAVAHGADAGMTELGHGHDGLPDDLLNFHYDPVACAVAAGWDGAIVREERLRPVLEGDLLRFTPSRSGRVVRTVVAVDSDGFAPVWLAAVEAAQAVRT